MNTDAKFVATLWMLTPLLLFAVFSGVVWTSI